MATKQSAKKPAAKSTAGKSTGKSLVRWEEALAARAKSSQAVASNLGTGGNFISFRNGILQFKGSPVDGNSMEVVIPSFILENQFYDGAFDADNPSSPVCYAFGTDQNDMAPHPKSPQPQSDKCKGCPQNEWGTADKGRGKACKNVVRLGLISADALEDGEQGVRDAEEAIAKLPVTSGKAWGAYVASLEAADLPPLAFITEMKVVPDPKNQFAVTFKAKEQIDDGDVMGALLERADVMDKTLATPYPDFTDDMPAPRKAPAGRKAAPPARKPAGKAPAPAARKARKF